MINRKKRKGDSDGFEQWGGYMNAKISKLEAQYEEEKLATDKNQGKTSELFKGVAIFVNGYTEPSADELRCLMLIHGGVYHHYYRSGKTTHIIASALPNAKFDQMKSLKVVMPEWITASIEAGKLLNYNNYLLQNNLPNPLHSKKLNTLPHASNGKGVLMATELKTSKTAADKGYLTEFYNNSRLHYISTLGNMLKQYVWEMRENHNGGFPKRKILIENSNLELFEDDRPLDGQVMHIDMDCFFVSVALRKYPHLKGQPIAVAHARSNSGSNCQNVDKKFELDFYKKKMEAKVKGENHEGSESNVESDDESIEEWSKELSSMSEIASCSYEARKAGVSKGMYLGAALKLCPNLKTVPYDFEGYKEVSMTLYNTVAQYTLDIEAISCDELFIDCSSLMSEVRIQAYDFAQVIRNEIEEKTKCTSSVGIAGNKLLARMATKHAKPNGQYHLTQDKVDKFMKDLSVYDLPGVGRSIGTQLKNLSVKTCGDLQKIPLATLKKEFGVKTGESLYKHCRGLDDRKVNFNHERKSVSAEVNYGIRFNDDEEAKTFLTELSGEVSKRLKDIGMMGKSVTFKVMFRTKDAPAETAKYLGHGACDAASRSLGLSSATSDPSVIAKTVINLYHQLGIPANELRGLGIQVTKLESAKKTGKTLQSYFGVGKQGERDDCRPINVPGTSSEVVQVQNGPSNDLDKECKMLPNVTGIDYDVLNSLPKHIYLEILKEYKLENISMHNNRVVKNADVCIKGGETTNNTTASGPQVSNVDGEATQIFYDMTLNDFKVLIKEWVETEHQPKSFDVNMLENYLKSLIDQKQLENLCILLRCFNRHVRTYRSTNRAWAEILDKIVSTVQQCVLIKFGRTMANEIIY